jgi:hypothetical protein
MAPFAVALSTILIVIGGILRARILRPMDEEADSDGPGFSISKTP